VGPKRRCYRQVRLLRAVLVGHRLALAGSLIYWSNAELRIGQEGGTASILAVVSNEQPSDADRLTAAADEVEAGHGPVAISRPGHKLVVVVSAEDWQRLEQLESAESTAWWRRDAAERAAQGEEPAAGEDGPGLDEAGFRRLFGHLLNDAGAA